LFGVETGSRVKIVFVISTLAAAGGAQRVTAGMINYWAKKGWEIVAITSDDGSLPAFYEIHPAARTVPTDDAGEYAGLVRAIFRNAGRVWRLRKEIRKSEAACVIAIGDIIGIRTILATIGLKTTVVVSEHLDPAQLGRMKNGLIWSSLRSCVYPFADKVVTLNDDCKGYFSEYLRKRIVVIPNAVPDESELSDGPVEVPNVSANGAIVTVGRLIPQKRYDILLRAFASIRDSIDNNVIIVGDGPLRGELEKLSASLGIRRRVLFTGMMRKPWTLLKDGLFFVMSSEFEGFPMSLLEAMVCGLPVVSFDCRTGPRDIIRHGIDGVLVPALDVEALAREMKRMATNHERRRLMASHAREIGERFGANAVMARWEALVESCRQP
jgi:glycosyltransferase involved in cell wall biosynthesis